MCVKDTTVHTTELFDIISHWQKLIVNKDESLVFDHSGRKSALLLIYYTFFLPKINTNSEMSQYESVEPVSSKQN